MNWVGGARNRVKFNGERKIQKDFFDKKRLGPKLAAERISFQKKPKLSQDLLALHTVSRAHSQLQTGKTLPKPIKSVDFGKFRSCTQPFNEVDMGPCSPGQTPSRILLNEGTSENNFQPTISGREIHTSTALSSAKIPKKVPRAKPELDADRDSGFSFSLSDGSSYVHKKESFIEKDRELLKENRAASSDQAICSSAGKVSSCRQFSNNKSIMPKKRDSFLQTSYDPFASEDFQRTPLVNYGTVKTKHRHGHKHRQTSTSVLNENTDHTFVTTRKENSFQFSSTPFCNTVTDHGESRCPTSIIQLSPIRKLPVNDKAGLMYKPRPVVSERQGKPSFEEKYTGTLDCPKLTNESHRKNKHHNHKHRMSSGTHGYSDKTMMNQLRTNYDSVERLYSDSAGNSSMLEEVSPLSDSSDDFDQNLKRKDCRIDTPEAELDNEDLPDRTLTSVTPCSSLSQYRKHSHSSHSLSGSEKLNISTSTANMEKPVFSDTCADDDFVYKPNKSFQRSQISERPSSPAFSNMDDEALHYHAATANMPHNQDTNSIRKMGSSPKPKGDVSGHTVVSASQTTLVRNEEEYNGLELTCDQGIDHAGEMNNLGSTSKYVPITNQMEDVLKEMSQLEEQDTEIPDETVNLQLQKKVPATEGDEVDQYIEAEELMMAHLEEEYLKYMKETTSENTQNCHYKVQVSAESHPNTCIDNKAISEVSRGKAADTQCGKVDSQTEELEGNIHTDLDNDLPLVTCDAASQKIMDNGGKIMKIISAKQYSELTVQVADVSSGKNQYTQTDVLSRQTDTDAVDVATSPCQRDTISVGVQCDMVGPHTVPSLVQTACHFLSKCTNYSAIMKRKK